MNQKNQIIVFVSYLKLDSKIGSDVLKEKKKMSTQKGMTILEVK